MAMAAEIVVPGAKSDIENVGRTGRHGTFLEMLGNFSFGDYYKREAIVWAWEYLTQRLRLDPEKLYVTVHTGDDEAQKLWETEVGLSPARIAIVVAADRNHVVHSAGRPQSTLVGGYVRDRLLAQDRRYGRGIDSA